MSVARVADKFPRFIVRHFGGGHNPSVNLFALSDNEIANANNVVFGNRGSVAPRKGFRQYDSSTGAHLDASRRDETRRLYRYAKSDGTKEWIIQADKYIYADRDLTQFIEIHERTQDTDILHIAQWKDTLAFPGTIPRWYNRGETTEVKRPLTSGIISFAATVQELFTEDLASDLGSLNTTDEYYYRFDFEFFHGDDFLARTRAANTVEVDVGASGRIFYAQNGGTTSTGAISLKKLDIGSALDSDATQGLKTINVYRTGRLTAAPNNEEPVSTFGFVGSVDYTDYDAAAVGDVLFTDTGVVAPQFASIPRYNIYGQVLANDIMRTHKSRMWLIKTRDTALVDSLVNEVVLGNKYRVYHSELNEPAAFRFTSFFDVGPGDGEAITQAFSWKNKALFVFKDNSTWGVFGGDNESINSQGRTTGVIDIEIEQIDESIGCVAPESMVYGEGGLIFLSNRDIEFFDGVRIRPLREDIIKPVLDKIPPSRISRAAGVYVAKDRKYLLQISTNDSADPDNNTIQIEYAFKTNTFSVHEYSIGFNGFVEARKEADELKVYAITSLTALAQATAGAVQILGDVMYENLENVGVAWSFKTKPIDCGEPDIEKRFIEVIVKMKTPEDISMDYDVDDGQEFSSTSITISNVSAHTWDEANLNWQGSPIETVTHVWGGTGKAAEQVVSFEDQNLYGNRIALEFSGTATLEGTEIQSIILVYSRERRIRTTGATT